MLSSIKLFNESTICLYEPARLSRKTTSQSPWRTTQAGKRQVKYQISVNWHLASGIWLLVTTHFSLLLVSGSASSKKPVASGLTSET
jgi:hypothetical protein